MKTAKKRVAPGDAPPIRTVTDAEVARHFPLVHFVIKRMIARGQIVPIVDLEDIEAVGRWAIWEALRRWSPDKGKQSTYLSSYIWGYIMHHQKRATRAQGWSAHEGRQIATVSYLEQAISSAGTGQAKTLGDTLHTHDDTAEQGEAAATLDLIRDRINAMPPVDRAIAVALLSGIPPSTLTDRLGISRSRIMQRADRIRAKLALPAEPAAATILVDRDLHPTERDAVREARRVKPEHTVTAAHKRKLRKGRVVNPQGRVANDGSLGRPVWELELAAA